MAFTFTCFVHSFPAIQVAQTIPSLDDEAIAESASALLAQLRSDSERAAVASESTIEKAATDVAADAAAVRVGFDSHTPAEVKAPEHQVSVNNPAENNASDAAVVSTLPHSEACDDAKALAAPVARLDEVAAESNSLSGLTVDMADTLDQAVPFANKQMSASPTDQQSPLAQQQDLLHPQTPQNPRPWEGAAAAAVVEAAAALAAHEAARAELRASALKDLMEGRVTDRLQKYMDQQSGKSPSMGALSPPASASATRPVIGFAGSGVVDLRFAPLSTPLAGMADADGSPQSSPRVSFFESDALPQSSSTIPLVPFSFSFSAASLLSPNGRDRGAATKLVSFADLSANSAGVESEREAANRNALSAAENSMIAAALVRANSRTALVVDASSVSSGISDASCLSPVYSADDTGFLRLPTPQLQYPPALQRKLSAAASSPSPLSPSSSKSGISAPAAPSALAVAETYTLAQVLQTIPAPCRFGQSEVSRAICIIFLFLFIAWPLKGLPSSPSSPPAAHRVLAVAAPLARASRRFDFDHIDTRVDGR